MKKQSINNNSFVKITLILTITSSLIFTSVANAEQICGHGQTSIDPELHVGFSAVSGYLGESYIHSKYNSASQKILIGTAIGSIPGLLKEMVDYADTESYCGEDMLLNIGGAFVGSLIAYNMNNKYRVTFNKQNENYFVGVNFKD